MQTANCRHLAGMVLPSRVGGWELSYHCINSLDTLEAIAPLAPSSVACLCLWNGKQISGWPRARSDIGGVWSKSAPGHLFLIDSHGVCGVCFSDNGAVCTGSTLPGDLQARRGPPPVCSWPWGWGAGS